ncbi:MAG: bifunctional folylpolyglutamate synthase/dihydrofolate synthase [Bacteroidales bacterium]|nr:bifunctional folylpolyglutamate synthase/dihydrofolate synthase [Bacteroidales bacterium]
MTYEDRIALLFARHRSVQSAGFSAEAYKPGLDAMLRFCAALGNPQLGFRSIHVAGTNGKGSVCSMIAAALAAQGLRVGLYTSPHLLDFRERMKIITRDGWSMISKRDVVKFLVRSKRFSEGLTFFEITTGMAFSWFAGQKVDIAVIETGLGGRLDSTNIITPELSVVTSIGLDHCELLGPDRASIAAEKAGIFKPGVPALVWGRDEETAPVFERIARETGSPLHYAEDYPGELPDCGPNTRTVYAALKLLGRWQDAAPLADAARLTGLRARWEVLIREPLTICDIGHNPPALAHNFARLEALRGSNPRRPLIIVYGAMADKDVPGIVRLMPRDAKYYLVVPATPRAMGMDDLALNLKQFRFECPGSVADGVRDALREARGLKDPIIYIGGSTYVAAEAISYIKGI